MTSLNGFNFTWDGRRLSSAISADTNISYTYNHDGIRTSKTINGITTYYEVDENNNVIEQTDGTNTIKFVYDSNNAPVYFIYNNSTYYYEKNLQGDIVAILDTNGNTVVEYSYDIWGKLLGITGELADTLGVSNPLRYRGYYYDTETGLYYLQSRYYSPDLMRFISQDDPVLSNDQGQPLGSNIYAYCLNNPLNYSDPTGTWVSFARAYIVLRLSTAFANYMYNSRNDITSGYINGQAIGKIAKLRFGLFKMSYNGCEVISIYNALRLKNKGLPISKIAFEMETNGASTLFGIFGSNPYFIGLFLSAHRIKYDMTLSVSKLDKLKKENGVYIISFWNSKTIFDGLHTVAVKYSKGKFTVYNRYSNRSVLYTYNSFKSIFSGGKFIVGYYLR